MKLYWATTEDEQEQARDTELPFVGRVIVVCAFVYLLVSALWDGASGFCG